MNTFKTTHFTAIIAAVIALAGCTKSKDNSPVGPTRELLAPTNLNATVISSREIDLRWADNSDNEEGFKLQRKIGADSIWFEVAQTTAEATAWQDSGLTLGICYTYRVQAFDSLGSSLFSNEDSVTTYRVLPAAPSDLILTVVSPFRIDLIWRDHSSNEEGFNVERRESADTLWRQVAQVSVDTMLYESTGLTPNRTYSFRVSAFNSDGASTYTAEASATTDPIPPAAPSNLSATVLSPVIVRLDWIDNSPDEEGFRIERAFTEAEFWAIIDTVAPNTVTYRDDSLSEGLYYRYRISGFIRGANSIPTEPVIVATPLFSPWSSLRALRDSETSIRLNWIDSSRSEYNYQVERRTTGAEYALIVSPPRDSETLLDANLTPNTLYYYRVRAMKDTITSAWSNEASARTTVFRPAAPTDLVAVGGEFRPNAARLTWRDNSADELGYVVEASLTGDSDWVIQDSLHAGITSADVSGLAQETTVFFRIYAWNSYGNSDYSNVASCPIEGLPIAPTNLNGMAPNYFAAQLSWQDNSISEHGFRVERQRSVGGAWTNISTLGANAVQFNDSSVIPVHEYSYRVFAFNDIGNSAYSNEVTVQIPPAPPLAPRSLEVSALDVDRAVIFWQDMSDDEDGFFIERRNPGEAQFTFMEVLQSDVTTYTDSTLTPDSWYSYRVRAHNAAGFSDYSNVDSAKTGSLMIFEDNFENYLTDREPTAPWSILNEVGTSWAHVTMERPHRGMQSLQIHDPDPGANYVMVRGSGFEASEATLAIWFFIPPNGTFGFMAGDVEDMLTFQIQFNADNTIFVRNGNSLIDPGINYPLSQWFKVDAAFSSATGYYHLSINDQAFGDSLQMVRAGSPTTQILFIGFSDAIISDGFVDDILLNRAWSPAGAPWRNSGSPTPNGFDSPVTIESAIRAFRAGGPQR